MNAQTTLGDVCTFVSGSVFPQSEQGASNGDLPFAKVKDLGSASGSSWPCISNWITYAQQMRLKASLIPEGSVVFAKIGEGLRRNRFAVAPREMVIDNNMMAALPDPRRVDRRWFLHLLEVLDLAQFAVGTALPYLRQSDLKAISFEMPPLATQRAIAEVLGALDDKIAANRRTLEMANELFRAKFDALPKSADRTLDSIAMLVRDHVSSSDINPNEQYVGLEHFDSKCIWLTKSGVGSDITSGKTRFNEGDALFGRLRPYFHKVAVASFNGICSTDILVVRPKSPELKSLVIGATSSDAAVQAAVMNSNGTKMPRAKWEDIRSLPVPDHTTEQAQAFSTTGAELVSLARALARENKVLASTRDELLPLLMSGRITVGAASSRVEEVV